MKKAMGEMERKREKRKQIFKTIAIGVGVVGILILGAEGCFLLFNKEKETEFKDKSSSDKYKTKPHVVNNVALTL